MHLACLSRIVVNLVRRRVWMIVVVLRPGWCTVGVVGASFRLDVQRRRLDEAPCNFLYHDLCWQVGRIVILPPGPHAFSYFSISTAACSLWSSGSQVLGNLLSLLRREAMRDFPIASLREFSASYFLPQRCFRRPSRSDSKQAFRVPPEPDLKREASSARYGSGW